MLIAQLPNRSRTGDSHDTYDLLTATQWKVEDQGAPISGALGDQSRALHAWCDLVPIRPTHGCTMLKDIYRLSSPLGNTQIQGLYPRAAFGEDGTSYRPAVNVG